FRRNLGVAPGDEYEPFAGLDVDQDQLRQFLSGVPFAQGHRPRRHDPASIAAPDSLEVPPGTRLSTQVGFGRLLGDLAQQTGGVADRIVTTAPDVTVSTNLGAWVSRRGIFERSLPVNPAPEKADITGQKWEMSRAGQHIELGIAENNLFLLLAALG